MGIGVRKTCDIYIYIVSHRILRIDLEENDAKVRAPF